MPLLLVTIGKLILALALIYFYYFWVKKIIFRHAPYLAHLAGYTKKYPVMTAAGVIQLTLIAFSHACFCVFLVYLLKIKLIGLSIAPFSLLICGFLIGIGSMGVATLFCQMGMLFSETFYPDHSPSNAKSWLTIARGGWMRHHLHNVEIMPTAIAFLIILIQISSEEVVFRGIMLNFFIGSGEVAAIIISTLLFSYMQIFHMSSKTSAMFPVLGALVLGLTNGILYINAPFLLPLIIAHLAFFIVAVL